MDPESGRDGVFDVAISDGRIAAISEKALTGVRVIDVSGQVVAPGFIDTDMTRELSEAQTDLMLGQIPLGRLGAPEEIAATVAFLCSDAAGYITGETVHINGGMYMA